MHKRRSAVYFRTSCMASVSQMFFKFIMPCLSRYLACGSSLWPIHPVDVVPQPVVAGWIDWHAALKIILTGCVCPHMMTYSDMHACSPFSSSALRPFVALCWQQAGWLELLGSYSLKKHACMHAMAWQGDGRNIFDYSGGCSRKFTHIIMYPWKIAVFVFSMTWEAEIGGVCFKQTVTRKRQIDAAWALRWGKNCAMHSAAFVT